MDKVEYLDALVRWTDYTLLRLGAGVAVIMLLAMACMCGVSLMIAALIAAILGG